MKSITATIITLNEEKKIKGAIDSISDVFNEIIVVDSKSDDNTVEIAKSLGAKVYIQEYLGDGFQKNLAARFAQNDWILCIDADERLGKKVIHVINTLDLENTEFDAFAFNRKTFMGNRWIKLWYPDCVVRLYNKNRARFRDVKGHARVITNNYKKIDCDILHYSYEDYTHMLGKLNRFSTRGARILFEDGKKVSHFDPFFHALFAFIRKFFLKRGVLYGLDGFTISMLTAVGTYMKYMKLIEIKENELRDLE